MRKIKKKRKGRKKERKETKKSQWADFQYRWHTLVSDTPGNVDIPTTSEKKIFLRSKGLMLFMTSNFSQADQRRAQWLCSSQLTLILFQAKEADKHCDTACQRMLNKLLSSLRFHLLLQTGWERCHTELQRGQITTVTLRTHHTGGTSDSAAVSLQHRRHHSEQGDWAFLSGNEERGDSYNANLKSLK